MESYEAAALIVTVVSICAACFGSVWVFFRYRIKAKELDLVRTESGFVEALEEVRADVQILQHDWANRVDELTERVDIAERQLLRAARADFAVRD